MIFQATLTNILAGNYRWHILEYTVDCQNGLANLTNEANNVVRNLAGDVSPILLRDICKSQASALAESALIAVCIELGSPMVGVYRDNQIGFEVVWVHPTETNFVVGDTLGDVVK